MRSNRGVSLIEALVALAVMAFGMLGVVALQSTMRQNADIAKQRSEAVRLAQAAIESRRAFTEINTTAGKQAYADLIDQAAETIVGVNATYARTVTIPDLGSGRSKSMVVEVRWEDRTGAAQSVRLSSSVTGTQPELAATLGLPFASAGSAGGPIGRPRGRQPTIPPAAIDQGDGTSTFSPPGSTGVQWVFNNATGYLTVNCVPAPDPAPACPSYRLLTGYVVFATGSTQPTPVLAEYPTGTAFTLDVAVDATAPVAQTISCFKDAQATTVAYYCAMPVDPLSGTSWRGRSYLTGGGLSVASSASDATASRHRVCRYTTVRGCQPAVGDTIWGALHTTASCSGSSPTPSRLMSNPEHPLDYLNVKESLANQNFLVIRAGDGSTAFTCPPDDTATPLIQSNTWDHQPSS